MLKVGLLLGWIEFIGFCQGFIEGVFVWGLGFRVQGLGFRGWLTF